MALVAILSVVTLILWAPAIAQTTANGVGIDCSEEALTSTINSWWSPTLLGLSPELNLTEGSSVSLSTGSRIFHATTTTDGQGFFLYGGFVPGLRKPLQNVLWQFNASTLTWTMADLQQMPTNRAFHTMNVLDMQTSTIILVFGGLAIDETGFGMVLNDLWFYSGPNSNGFNNLTVDGGPSARFGHSATTRGNTLFVMGGCVVSRMSNSIFPCQQLADSDLWQFTIESLPNSVSWSHFTPSLGRVVQPFMLAMDTMVGSEWYLMLGVIGPNSYQTEGETQSLVVDLASVASLTAPMGVILDLTTDGIVVAMRGSAATLPGGVISLLLTVRDPGTTLVTPTQVTNFEVVVNRTNESAALLLTRPHPFYSTLSWPSESFTGAGLFSGGMSSNVIGSVVLVYGLFYTMEIGASQNIEVAPFWQYTIVPDRLFSDNDCSGSDPSNVIIWTKLYAEELPSQRYALATYKPDTATAIYVLGGSQGTGQSPFLWVLNLGKDMDISNSWWTSQAVSPTGAFLSTPPSRSYFSALPVAGSTGVGFAIYGGIAPSQAEAYGDLWLYSNLQNAPPGTGNWQQLCTGTQLPPRAAYAAISNGSAIFVFGGWSNVSNFPQGAQNTLITIPLEVGAVCPYVVDTTTSADIPGLAQMGSSTVQNPLTGNPAMLIFGGVLSNGVASNALYMYDIGDGSALSSPTWTTLSVNGVNTAPIPRAGCAVAAIGSKFFVVGGITRDLSTGPEPLQDVWYFDLLRKGWTQLATVGNGVEGLARFGAGISVVGSTLILFAGLGQTNTLFRGYDNPLSITVGCNPGEFSPDFASVSCSPCALGYYAEQPGSTACTRCQGSSWTEALGANSVSLCKVCQPGICAHGTCELQSDLSFVCTCEVGYTGETCSTPWLVILLSTFLGCLLVSVALGFCHRQYRRGFSELSGLYQEQQELLLSSKIELEDLRHVFDIKEDELVFKRRIDSGSEGAFGEVWEADWHDRHVAVKKLRASVMAFDENAFRDFEKEVSLLQTVRHRNIVYFYGAGVVGDTPFLVLEYCARGSLYSVLVGSSTVLTQRRRAGFALDTAHGMHFLHSLNPPRIHRDLKSFNLLVSESFVVKIGDFGTAKKMDQLPQDIEQINTASTRLAPTPLSWKRRGMASEGRKNLSSDLTNRSYELTSNDDHAQFVTPNSSRGMLTTNVGTLRWSSPEVLKREPYGLKTDVYSYGMILFEIQAREPPYLDIGHAFDVRNAILSGERPKIPQYTPPTMAALMDRCWQQAAADRPTFAEVITILEAMPAAELLEEGDVNV